MRNILEVLLQRLDGGATVLQVGLLSLGTLLVFCFIVKTFKAVLRDVDTDNEEERGEHYVN